MDCWVLCAHVWVAVVCTVWRSEVSIRSLLCLFFTLFFLRKGLSLNLRLSDSAKLADSGSLPIPTSQSWDHSSQPVWLPTWVLYSLSLLPSPSSQIFGCPGMLVWWIFNTYFWMDWSVVCAYWSEFCLVFLSFQVPLNWDPVSCGHRWSSLGAVLSLKYSTPMLGAWDEHPAPCILVPCCLQ